MRLSAFLVALLALALAAGVAFMVAIAMASMKQAGLG
jgi:hypothetical protein